MDVLTIIFLSNEQIGDRPQILGLTRSGGFSFKKRKIKALASFWIISRFLQEDANRR